MNKPKLYDEDDITRYIDIVIGQFKEDFKSGFEAIEFIKQQVKKIPILEEKIDGLSNDMVAVKALLKIHDQEIKNLQTVADSH